MKKFKCISASWYLGILVLSACQSSPGIDLDFVGARLEFLINGKAYTTGDTYNWGNASTSSPIVVSAQIRNPGRFSVSLASNPAITVSGAQASEVAVTQPASPTLEGGATQNVTITITPVGPMTRTAVITIKTNTGNEAVALTLKGYRHGVILIKDINSGPASASPTALTLIGSTLYFRATDAATGAEPWKTDGNSSETVMIKDIYPGTTSSSPSAFTQLGNTVLFSAADAVAGRELWKTDGTLAGTILVADIYAGATSGNPDNNGQFAVLNGRAIFCAETAASGVEVWSSDGTTGGTGLVADLGVGDSCIAPIFKHNSTYVVFSGETASEGRELYRSTGVPASAITMVQNINSGMPNANPSDFISFAGVTVFSADNGAANGTELWKTNATPSSASMAADIRVGASNGSPKDFFILGSNLLYWATDGTTGYELYRSTTALTSATQVKDINAGAGDAYPANPTAAVIGNQALFKACSTATDCELWITDGSTVGTNLLKDINPGGAAGSNPTGMTLAGGVAYFSANDGTNGIELWRTDGSAAGTYMVSDINSGAANSSPANFVASGNNIFFTATTATYGTELYIFVPPP